MKQSKYCDVRTELVLYSVIKQSRSLAEYKAWYHPNTSDTNNGVWASCGLHKQINEINEIISVSRVALLFTNKTLHQVSEGHPPLPSHLVDYGTGPALPHGHRKLRYLSCHRLYWPQCHSEPVCWARTGDLQTHSVSWATLKTFRSFPLSSSVVFDHIKDQILSPLTGDPGGLGMTTTPWP